MRKCSKLLNKIKRLEWPGMEGGPAVFQRDAFFHITKTLSAHLAFSSDV